MAKRCIYADDFLDLFYVASAGQDKMFVKVVEQVVEDTPTADVQEVVRCKDCKYFDRKHLMCGRCGDIDEPCGGCLYNGSCTYDDGYCHHGERRKE